MLPVIESDILTNKSSIDIHCIHCIDFKSFQKFNFWFVYTKSWYYSMNWSIDTTQVVDYLNMCIVYTVYNVYYTCYSHYNTVYILDILTLKKEGYPFKWWLHIYSFRFQQSTNDNKSSYLNHIYQYDTMLGLYHLC